MDYTGNIPKDSRETFLTGTSGGRRALQSYGLGDYGCGWSKVKDGYNIHRSAADTHLIIYTICGNGELLTPDKRAALIPGSVAFLPAHGRHSYRCNEAWEFLWFHPSDKVLWNELFPKQPVLAKAKWLDQIKGLAREFIFESVKMDRTLHESVLRGFAHLIALFLQRELSSAQPEDFYDERIKFEDLWASVSESPGKDWSIEILARMAGMSRSKLHSYIRRLYGCGAMEIVTRIRMEYAEELIVNRNTKLSTVAELVGYNSPYSFSRAFKRFAGMSPENIRKEGRRPSQATKAS